MVLFNIFIQIFLINFLILICSNFIYNFFNFQIKINNNNVYEKILFGYFFISCIGLLVNFILPISFYIGIFLTISGILAAIKFISYFSFKEIIKIILQIIYLSFFCLILLLFSKFQEDFPWYSLPFISLISEDKISFGISNIQFRFGHISILSYGSAVLANNIFHKLLLSLPYASTVSCFILIIIDKIFRSAQNNLSNLFLFFIGIFCLTKFTRFAEYGNDTPAHILLFFTIYLFIKIFEEKNYDNKLFISKKIFFFSLFCVMQKQQLGLIVALPAYFFLIHYKKFLIKKNFKIFFTIFVIIISWMAKSFINTSCLVYPAYFTCYEETSWSPKSYSDHSHAKKVSIESSSWAKGWPDQIGIKLDHKDYVKNFNWLKTWSQGHLLVTINQLLPFFVISLIAILFTNFLNQNKLNNGRYKNNWTFGLALYLLISCLIWFVTFPTFRYYSSFIVSLFSLFFILLLKKKMNSNFTKIIIALSLIFFISKNLLRINSEYSNQNLKYLPNIYRITNKSDLEFVDINNFIVILSRHQACKYGSIICTHHGHVSKNTILIEKKYGYKFYKLR